MVALLIMQVFGCTSIWIFFCLIIGITLGIDKLAFETLNNLVKIIRIRRLLYNLNVIVTRLNISALLFKFFSTVI